MNGSSMSTSVSKWCMLLSLTFGILLAMSGSHMCYQQCLFKNVVFYDVGEKTEFEIKWIRAMKRSPVLNRVMKWSIVLNRVRVWRSHWYTPTPPLERALHPHELAVRRQQSERNLQLCLHKSKESIISKKLSVRRSN